METKNLMAAWGGPDRDVLAVLPDWTDEFSVALLDDHDDVDIVAYRALDEDEEPTGDIVGFEILDFLDFSDWNLVPELPVKWSINNGPAGTPRAALQALQQQLRARTQLIRAS